MALGLGAIIGSVLGKDGIAGKVLDKFVQDKDLKAKMLHELDMATQDDNQEYRVLIEQAESEMFVAQQETIQAELHQTDLYTKRTRPKIARQSWYITGFYAVTGMILPALPASLGLQMPAIDWQIFIVLASPALTYMGVRGLEKWKAGGASK